MGAVTKTFKNPYKNEHELCEAFSAYARSKGWRVFPETASFDLLLVATDEVKTLNVRPGDQVGVEAKTRANVEVLAQAAPNLSGSTGPHYHAVLVPRASKDFKFVAQLLRITVIEACHYGYQPRSYEKAWIKDAFHRSLTYFPDVDRMYYDSPCWHPEVEMLVPAGVRGPRKVTPWKVNAIRLCLLGRKRGYLTSEDFRRHNVSMSHWVRSHWIEDTGKKIGRLRRYRLTDEAPDLQNPEIVEALKAEESPT